MVDMENVTDQVGSEEKVVSIVDYWQYGVYKALFIYCTPLVMLLGTVGNIFAMIVLLSDKMRSSSTNLILTVLAVADLGLLYTSALRAWILHISGYLDVRSFNIHTCRIHMFFTFFSSHLSPMTLALMTVERAISVCAPLQAKVWCSRGNTIKALIVLIICLAGVNVVNFTSMTFEQSLSGVFSCYYNDRVGDAWFMAHSFFQSYIPCVVIIIGNGVIIYKLVIAEKRRSTKMGAADSAVGSSSRSTTTMLLGVSFVFLVTTLPFQIYTNGHNSLWPMSNPDLLLRVRSMLAYAITYELSMLNNAINFILYCAFGRVFREAFVDLMGCRKKKKTAGTQVFYTGTTSGAYADNTDGDGSKRVAGPAADCIEQ